MYREHGSLEKKYILTLKDGSEENTILHESDSREECCEALNKYVREMLKKVLENKYEVDVIIDRPDRYEATIISKEKSRDIVLDVSI